MAAHNDKGKEGEEMAAAWFTEKGYEILHRNWKASYYEIDIIASKNDTLHFVEVKTRKSSKFGFPEDSVTKKKFRDLQNAANQFLNRNPRYKWVQFDILSIIHPGFGEPEILLLEDVFL